jgi:adenine-specific DNA-methyltransferase
MNLQKALFEEEHSFKYPSTRFQGSKRKLLNELEAEFSNFEFKSCIDLFSGSGSVSFLLRKLGKEVCANDYLKFNENTAKVFLTDHSKNEINQAMTLLPALLNDEPKNNKKYVQTNFENIFFTDSENKEIDNFCQNINRIEPKIRFILIYAVGQSLLKKRPYNLFHRANLGMRLSDVKRSFGNKKTWDTPILNHSIKAIEELLDMRLSNLPTGSTMNVNSSGFFKLNNKVDLVYLDPPYIPAKGSAIDYSDFYGFLEGLVDYDLFKITNSTAAHKPLSLLNSAWSKKESAEIELNKIIKYWEKSHIILSYRDDGAFSTDELENIFKKNNRNVELKVLSNYKYALSHSIKSNEILLISNSGSFTKKMTSH